MFKETKTLVGFSVMENPHKSGKKDIPELLAFVPFEAGGIKPPTSPPEAGVALQAYMSAFRNCAQKDDCDSEGSAAQH